MTADGGEGEGRHGATFLVGEAVDGRKAVRLAQELLPDVAVMDISMPAWDRVEATRKLGETCPQVRVLALTRHSDYGFLTEMPRAEVDQGRRGGPARAAVRASSRQAVVDSPSAARGVNPL
jgi:chemotaxis response regulator CheB